MLDFNTRKPQTHLIITQDVKQIVAVAKGWKTLALLNPELYPDVQVGDSIRFDCHISSATQVITEVRPILIVFNVNEDSGEWWDYHIFDSKFDVIETTDTYTDIEQRDGFEGAVAFGNHYHIETDYTNTLKRLLVGWE